MSKYNFLLGSSAGKGELKAKGNDVSGMHGLGGVSAAAMPDSATGRAASLHAVWHVRRPNRYRCRLI